MPSLPREATPEIPYLRLLGFYALFLLAPLGAGMLIGDRSPRLAAKLTSFLASWQRGAVRRLHAPDEELSEGSRCQRRQGRGGRDARVHPGDDGGRLAAGRPPFERRHLARDVPRACAMPRSRLAVARESPEGRWSSLPSLIAFSLLMVPEHPARAAGA